MRALVFDGQALRLSEVPEPAPGPDEALIHVSCAGVCATDLELLRGYQGFRGIPGHEFVGRVDDGDPELGGRRVVADINVACGACPTCERGDGHHCPQRSAIGIHGRPGAFAERIAVPRRNLVELPSHVDDERAVFAEPLAAALHVLDELPGAKAYADPGTSADAKTDTKPDATPVIRPDASGGVVVLGDGKLGLLTALAIAATGARTQLIGRHPHKLAIAAAAGVETHLDGERLTQLRRCAALVVEATGRPAGLARALELVRPRGTIVLKTTVATPVPIDLSAVVVDELRLVGSRCGEMRRAIELLASERIDPRPLIAARLPLARGPAALRRAAEPGVLKVLLEIGSLSAG